MKIGGKYNWINQKERLVYLGKEGFWHQFALVDEPATVWCEVLASDLDKLEETTIAKLNLVMTTARTEVKPPIYEATFTNLEVLEFSSFKDIVAYANTHETRIFSYKPIQRASNTPTSR